MTAELAAFIAARLDEAHAHWTEVLDGSPDSVLWVEGDDDLPTCIGIETPGQKRYRRFWPDTGEDDWGWVMHASAVELFSRAEAERALRDVEAKRRLLAMYEEAHAYYDTHQSAPAGELYGLWQALQLLVEAWSDHPHFRPEWTP